MKKVFFVLISLVLTIFLPVPALAFDKNVLITEVQTGTEASASQEFIEIYNNGIAQIDISGWMFYYKSATGSTWIKKATIGSRLIEPGKFFAFASNLQGDLSYSSTLSQTGGNIQIRDKSGAVMDQFAWGNGNLPLVKSAVESNPGQSMYRIYDFENHTMQNSDNNFDDFEIAQSSTMGKTPELVVPELDEEPIVYTQLELSELFPNPASPQSDTTDEFIEIYNPYGSDADLSGWKLKDESGAEFIIKDKVIISGSRLAISTVESKITLNNTGDSVQLINPNGEVVDESANYGDANEGLAWIKIGGQWQWAVGATPNQSNSEIYSEPETSPSTAVKNVKKSSSKASSSKKTSATKPKTSKVASSSKPKVNASNPIEDKTKSSNSNLWTWLLLAAGIATIGYGIYEYRTEIQLQLNKLRSKLGARR
jgi:hypothetical protein